jgi:hypothetical protein
MDPHCSDELLTKRIQAFVDHRIEFSTHPAGSHAPVKTAPADLLQDLAGVVTLEVTMNKHVKRNSAIDPSWIDLDVAMKFLRAVRPTGPWNLTAIAPDVAGAESVVHVDEAKARAWLAQRATSKNLYYLPNPAPQPTGANGRANRGDVTEVQYLHLDLDLDKLPPDHIWAKLGLADRKAQALQMLHAFSEPGAPSLVVDTAGGLQALWRLEQPTPPTADAYQERQNKRLIEVLGGDGGTFSVAQLMRLPGAINFPNAQKRARGRVVAPTKLIDSNDSAYDDFEFSAAEPKLDAGTVADIGAPEYVDDLEEFVRRYGLSDRLVSIIKNGRLSEPKDHDDSRSAWVFDCATSLVRARVPAELVVGLLLDDRWAIAESIVEKGEHESERAAYRTVKNAINAVRSEMLAFDDVSEEVAMMSETPNPRIERASRFTPLEIADMENLPIPEWLVEGWVTEFALGQVYGPRKRGKTFAVLDMALHIAMGWDWCGHKVKRKRVKYVVGEGSIGRFFDRIRAWCLEHKIDPSELSGWLSVVPVRVGIDNDRDIQEFFAADHSEVGVVVIDTVARNMDGDENATKDMNLFVKGADRIRDHYKCAVILVHHSGKDEGKAGRGSTVLPGAVDCTIKVSNSSTGLVVVRLEECRDGPSGEELAFEMRTHVVDGDDLRSSIALRARSVDVSLEDEVESMTAEEARGRCLIKIAEKGGVRTRAELVDENVKGMSRANVQKVVSWLREHGLIVAPGEGPITPTDAGVERARALGARVKVSDSAD